MLVWKSLPCKSLTMHCRASRLKHILNGTVSLRAISANVIVLNRAGNFRYRDFASANGRHLIRVGSCGGVDGCVRATGGVTVAALWLLV